MKTYLAHITIQIKSPDKETAEEKIRKKLRTMYFDVVKIEFVVESLHTNLIQTHE